MSAAASYSVVDRETGRVIGADLTLTQATTLRDALTTTGDPVVVPGSLREGDVLGATPADVLAGVADALRSLALQADRYDNAIAELWARIDGLNGSVAALRDDIDRLDRLGSVRA